MGLQPPSSSRRGHTRNTPSRRHAPNPNPPGGTLRNSANTSPYPPPPLPRDLQPLARRTEPKAALTPETRATTRQQMSRSLRPPATTRPQMSRSLCPPARQGTLGWRILSREIILSTPVLFPLKGRAARGLVERARGLGTSHPRRHSATHSLAQPSPARGQASRVPSQGRFEPNSQAAGPGVPQSWAPAQLHLP